MTQFTLAQASIPSLVLGLTNLKSILEKGQAFAEARKIDPTVLPASRLAPDMFPLSRQVQIATDAAKGLAARLTGTEVPSFADTETTFPELLERVSKTLAFVQGVDTAAIESNADKTVTLKAGPRELQFTMPDYLTTFALPNFYFHLTTTYLILRHNGVDLGKMDFLGELPLLNAA